MIVLNYEHHRRLPDRSEIECFMEIALRRGTIAEETHHSIRFVPQLDRITNPGRVQHLCRDNDRNRQRPLATRPGIAFLEAVVVE